MRCLYVHHAIIITWPYLILIKNLCKNHRCADFCLKSTLDLAYCIKITQNVAFEFCYFPSIFVLIKLTCLVTLFDSKLQVFKNSPNWTILCTFNSLLSTQNVNVARFAHNVERDFFSDFQTPCIVRIHSSLTVSKRNMEERLIGCPLLIMSAKQIRKLGHRQGEIGCVSFT